jgi:hypothetical protein
MYAGECIVDSNLYIFNGSERIEITEQEYNAKLQEGLNVLNAANARRRDMMALQSANALGIAHMESMIKHMKPKRGFYDVYLCNTEGNT